MIVGIVGVCRRSNPFLYSLSVQAFESTYEQLGERASDLNRRAIEQAESD